MNPSARSLCTPRRSTRLALANARIILFIMSAISMIACRANVKATSQRTSAAHAPGSGTGSAPDAPSGAAPIEIKDGFNVNRTYVQTRAPITIAIKAETAAPGDRISLFNDTIRATLLAQQSLALTSDVEGRPPYSLLEHTEDPEALGLAPYELTLTLFPLDPAFATKFTYGPNALRLLVDAGDGERFSTRIVTRADFPFVFNAGGSFPSRLQRSGGLEMRLGGVFQTTVTNGHAVLTVGKVSLISR